MQNKARKSRKGTNNSNLTVMGKIFVGHAMLGVTPTIPQNLLPYIGTEEFWSKVDIAKVNADRIRHGAPTIEGKILIRAGKGYKTLDAKTGAIEDYEGHITVQMIPVGSIKEGELHNISGKPYDEEGMLFLHLVGRGPQA